MRQNIKRREFNIKKKKALKRVIKEYQRLTASSKNEAIKLLPKVYKALDKAAKTKLIKKNKSVK